MSAIQCRERLVTAKARFDDGQGVPTFTPDEAAVPAERNKPPNQRHENKSSSNHGTAIEEQQKEEEKQTTRMEYAKSTVTRGQETVNVGSSVNTT